VAACAFACAPNPGDWRTYHAVAEAAAERGNYPQAEAHLAKAEPIALGLGPGESATTLIAQGKLRREVGDHEGARDRYSRAESLLESPETAPDHASLGAMQLAFERGQLALNLGDAAGAEPYFERALREARRSEGPDSLDEGWAQLGLGRSLRLQSKNPAARPALLRALAIFRGETSSTAVRPAHTPGIMAAYTELAALDRSEGRIDPARARVIDALRMGRRELGAGHPRIAPVLAELARIELARGDLVAAADAADRAEKIARDRLPIGHPSGVEAGAVVASVARAKAALTPP